MANYGYGIVSEPSSYDTSRNNYEMGWNFTTVKEFYFYGFRVKSPKVAEKVCTLWDSSQNAIARATLTTIVGEWVEVLLDEPILLEAGKEYTISTWTDNSYYYKSNATSYVTFNTEYLTFKNGKASKTKGTYPSEYTEKFIYPMIDCLISNEPPNIKRYLVRDGNTIYTVTDGALVEVSGTLNAELFQTSGVDAIPDGTLLMTLSNPEVLCWTDAETLPTLTVTEKATPFPQILVSSDYDMTHPSILGIEKVIVDATNGVLFAVSFDSGESWKIWTGQTWGELSEENTGMSAETINSITSEQWNEVATTGKFRFRVTLSAIEDKFKSLIVDYVNV